MGRVSVLVLSYAVEEVGGGKKRRRRRREKRGKREGKERLLGVNGMDGMGWDVL